MRRIAATILALGVSLATPATAEGQLTWNWTPHNADEAALFGLVLDLAGLSRGVDLRQEGRGNRVRVEQNGDSRALIRQRGQGNRARVHQRDGGSRVLLQLGRGGRVRLGGGSGVTLSLGF